MRIIGALACLIVLSAAGCVWLAGTDSTANQETLVFHPPVGDVRYFSVDQITEIGVSGRRGNVNRMTSVLRSEVQAVDDGVVELQSGAIKAVESLRGRTLVDTESGDQQDENMIRLAEFLQSGLAEKVSARGELMDSAYQNQDSLKSISDRPEVLQTILVRSLSVFSWYPGQFPNESLMQGLSWQVGNQQLGDATVKGVQIEITHLDEQTVTLEFGPAGPGGQPAGEDSRANIFSVTGYLELERDTGWPRQASMQIKAEQDHQGATFQVNSYLEVRQVGVDNGPDFERLLSMAKVSMRTRPVDASSAVFNDHFVPPFKEVPVDASLAKIQRTLLWFGSEWFDYGYGRGQGVESQLNSSNLHNATIHPVTSVRLLDAEGKLVKDQVRSNPDFRLLRPSTSRGQPAYAGIPFLREGLTGEQLVSVDVIELDVPVTKPDEMHSASLNKGDTEIELEDAGLRLIIDKWDPDVVRIRVSRSGGIAPGRLPWVIGYPVDEAGAPLPQFGVRMSHTLFESILGTMETPPRDERVMAEALIRGIATMPPHKRNGAFIYEFTRIGAQPIKRFKFHYYSTRTENMTFSAPAARKVMNGGEIVGERTMYSGDVPRFDFSHRGGEAGSYRMKRTSLPVAFSADGYQLEQVRRGTLQISGEWFKTLQNLQSTFDLKHLPVIAYNQQGDALVPFWHDRIGEPLERLENGDVLLRFWGEIAAVSYPEPADLVSEAEIR